MFVVPEQIRLSWWHHLLDTTDQFFFCQTTLCECLVNKRFQLLMFDYFLVVEFDLSFFSEVTQYLNFTLILIFLFIWDSKYIFNLCKV